MRYIRKTINKEPEATSECVSFLEGVYQSVAETLPDLNGASIASTLVDSPELLESEDAYRTELTVGKAEGQSAKSFKRKGPRKRKKGLMVFRDRAVCKEVRYLPPGRMKD